MELNLKFRIDCLSYITYYIDDKINRRLWLHYKSRLNRFILIKNKRDFVYSGSDYSFYLICG